MRILKIDPKIIESKPSSYFDIFCPLIGTSWFPVCLSDCLLPFVWQFPLSIQRLPLMLKLPCIWHYFAVHRKDSPVEVRAVRITEGREGRCCFSAVWSLGLRKWESWGRSSEWCWGCGSMLLPRKSGSRTVWVEADQLLHERQDGFADPRSGWPAPIFKEVCCFSLFHPYLFWGCKGSLIFSE